MDPADADRLHALIQARHSSRLPYDPALRVSEDELARIVDAARWAPTAHNMQNFRLVVADDARILEELGRIRSPVSPVFIAENFRQLSFSKEDLAARKVGLLGTHFPKSWWTDDPAQAPQDASRLLGEIIAGAPTVMLVLYDGRHRAPGSDGDRDGLISLGCVLENMWLTAQSLGLDLQVVSAFGSPGAEPEVKRVLAIPEPWHVALALRLGHAVKIVEQFRVRRDPEMFLSRNRF